MDICKHHFRKKDMWKMIFSCRHLGVCTQCGGIYRIEKSNSVRIGRIIYIFVLIGTMPLNYWSTLMSIKGFPIGRAMSWAVPVLSTGVYIGLHILWFRKFAKFEEVVEIANGIYIKKPEPVSSQESE